MKRFVRDCDNLEKIQQLFDFLKSLLAEDVFKKIISESCFHFIVPRKTDLQVCELSFELVESIFTKGELADLVKKKNDNYNLLQYAAAFGVSESVFEYLWQKILENTEDPKEFLLEKGIHERNLLQIAVYNKKEPKIFPHVFQVVESICSKEEIKNLMLLDRDSRKNAFLSLAVYNLDMSNLEFSLQKINQYFNQVEVKELQKNLRGCNNNHLLTIRTAFNNNSLESAKLLWDLFEQNLSREEMVKLLNSKDNDGDTILLNAAASVKSSAILSFLWSKLSFYFNSESLLQNYLKLENNDFDTALFKSIRHRNDFLFRHLLDYYCDAFKIKLLTYECDTINGNIFHYVARFGDISMVELTFETLKTKLNSLDENFRAVLDSNDFPPFSWRLPIHKALKYNSVEVLKYLIFLYEQYLTREKLVKILTNKKVLALASKNKASDEIINAVQEYLNRKG